MCGAYPVGKAASTPLRDRVACPTLDGPPRTHLRRSSLEDAARPTFRVPAPGIQRPRCLRCCPEERFPASASTEGESDETADVPCTSAIAAITFSSRRILRIDSLSAFDSVDAQSIGASTGVRNAVQHTFVLGHVFFFPISLASRTMARSVAMRAAFGVGLSGVPRSRGSYSPFRSAQRPVRDRRAAVAQAPARIGRWLPVRSRLRAATGHRPRPLNRAHFWSAVASRGEAPPVFD